MQYCPATRRRLGARLAQARSDHQRRTAAQRRRKSTLRARLDAPDDLPPSSWLLLAIFAAGWIVRAIVTYNDDKLGGLFGWIGIDFGFYLAQRQAFASGNLAALYSDRRPPALSGLSLAGYATGPVSAFPAGPVPYPPDLSPG